jgi:hypothetical protein
MPHRLAQLQRLQHGLFQANLLLSQCVHHLNFQLCAPTFSAGAMREAAAKARAAEEDVRACLDAMAALLDDAAPTERAPQ